MATKQRQQQLRFLHEFREAKKAVVFGLVASGIPTGTQIAQKTGISYMEVSQILSNLEFDGRIQWSSTEGPGPYIRRGRPLKNWSVKK